MQRLLTRYLSLILAFAAIFAIAACQPVITTQASISAALAVAAPVYPKGIAFGDVAARKANRDKNAVDQETLPAINAFAIGTSARILSGAGENSCYSPLSLYYALALAASGAGGETRDELLSLMGADSPDGLSQQCGRLYRLLYTDNEIGQLKIANSLWLGGKSDAANISFNDSYIDNAVKAFYASIFNVDFADAGTGKAMAEWIAANTNGTLNPEIETDPMQIMSIINTIYFYDQWVDRFDTAETRRGTFYLAGGGVQSCEFMNRIDASGEFSRGENYTRAAMLLKNGGSMCFILPDAGVDVASLLSRAGNLLECLTGGQMASGKVTWSLPKFSYSSVFSLKESLQALGVKSAFEGDADFSGITDSVAYISDVIQQTHIAVNEEGVEASAFTQIDFYGSGQPESEALMILDRPFIYCIVAPNGVILFVGVCGNPKAG